jgi:hypothetical protein
VTADAGGAEKPRIRDGRLFGFFAFDSADSIDLEAIPRVLRPERARIAPRRAPESVRWELPPVEITLGERTIPTPAGPLRAETTARLFDFGAVSIGFAVPLAGDLASLARLSESVAAADAGSAARAVLQEVLAEIRPALRGSGADDLVEDYWVFQVATLDPQLPAETLLAEHRALLAAILAQDTGTLSRQQIDETLREPLSYSPHDLVLADWSAAFVHDRECRDTLSVLEFLNVQLLELRVLDARLDRALGRFSREVYQPESVWRAFRGAHRPAIRALSELTVEALTLSERVENALKLVPDVYLARVHRRSAARLGLAAWERLVESKLDAVRHLSTVLVERSAAKRAEGLEWTIVLLIALEIGLALAGWLGE